GQDVRLLYARARLDSMQLNWGRVTEHLSPVVERHADFVPAYALYGRALVELDRLSDVPDWISRAPKNADQSPQYWMAIGRWAESIGEPGLAAKSFLNVLQINPTAFPESLSSLYRALIDLQLDEAAAQVELQIGKQIQLRDAFRVYLDRNRQSQSAALAVAETMFELGRLWEAEAWARHAVTLKNEPVDDVRTRYLTIRSELKATTPWILPDMELPKLVSIPAEMIPDDDVFKQIKNPGADPAASFHLSATPFFEDQAAQRGLLHTCEISKNAEHEGHWLHQSSGGGVGVVDFDLDSRPDVIGVMLDGQPLQSDSSPNRLFRNLGEQFVEIGSAAGYVDRGFSLGVTVGDINGDGFPDVLDTNIGQNRLFLNNGDGTFREISVEAGLTDSSWSTSGAIADFDGDGSADILVANYCAGSEPFSEDCRTDGKLSACAPTLFSGQEDRVWRGLGDGTFHDVTDKWMNQTTVGRGLGVVVGNLDERPGLDAYVANDMTVNHLWSGKIDEDAFRLVEIASVRGVGFNGKSQSQASMGIAAADADDDGDLDLLLTHFAKEHNTYYEQVAPGIWADRSFQSGLASPSINMLGFGTEWCDFDQDGWKELIVTNGHVDNYHLKDVGYAMPGQVFRQRRPHRWETCAREMLGDYFSRDHIGRSLASVDIDRDGRTDVLITHLYEQIALLVNRTKDAGQSLDLVLKSTRSHRDAIGAKVVGTVGSRKLTAFLTAGDGYMCSNERKICFGLGSNDVMQDITIHWPSGTTQHIGELQAGRSYLVVESQDSFPMMDFAPRL
ncbi:MAG: CRTAC1 family protein, partial [Planctomycetales bacterium]|nr:CRTAC1 family protein [Planctomycetales bacterium]